MFKKFLSQSKAQTAMELAVFGAILILVIGVIVNQGFNSSYQQNLQFKAMRMAMNLSFLYSEGFLAQGCNRSDPNDNYRNNEDCANGAGSRNSASVLIVEDRLTSSSAKYAAIDRSPFMLQGAATHSHHLFMELNQGSVEDIPRFDIFINGKHFPLTTVAFKKVCLLRNQGSCGIRGRDKDYDSWIGDDGGTDHWDRACPGGTECARLYTVVENSLMSKKWCDGSPDKPCSSNNISANQRFDLNRNGIFTGINEPDPSDPDVRKKFSWQWMEVKGIDDIEDDDKVGLSDGQEKIDSHNTSFDIDGDLEEEQYVTSIKKVGESVVAVLLVTDSQDADIDLTADESDSESAPGLTNETSIKTKTDQGTYLRLEEGKLYNDTQFVRSVTKKDQVDLVERVIRLSYDTGRFCNFSTATPKPNVDGLPNPVEVCCSTIGCCFDNPSGNAGKTCMYQGDPSSPSKAIRFPKIYIRSQIADFRGRKWVTQVLDSGINFKVPDKAVGTK